jgi:nucleotide-binding universal stress UspA family protein
MLARTFGAHLIVAHVGDLFTPIGPEYPVYVDLEGLRREADLRARQHLELFVGQHFADDRGVEQVMQVGIPHVEIVKLAVERHADLIVMATHGRGFVSKALLGSTTQRVLQRAPCAVLVVSDAQAHHHGGREAEVADAAGTDQGERCGVRGA